MSKTIQIFTTTEELKELFKEIIQEVDSQRNSQDLRSNEKDIEENFTSISDLAEYFNCSLPTAQKIKNAIPKNEYAQFGKRFSIPKSLLLRYGNK